MKQIVKVFIAWKLLGSVEWKRREGELRKGNSGTAGLLPVIKNLLIQNLFALSAFNIACRSIDDNKCVLPNYW